MNQNKKIGYEWEKIVRSYYEKKWYRYITSNFTIRGGEIDLIFTTQTTIIFVEVKVVNHVDDLHNYITPRKLRYLDKSITTYLYKFPSNKAPRLDVVFVKDGRIFQVFDSIGM